MSITRDRLMELVHYDPASGVFTSKVKRGKLKVGDILGNLTNHGYVRLAIHGKVYVAHRLAWFYVHGYFPKHQIDHINRIKSDNRLINLRECTQSENNLNTGARSDNTSGRKGVSWHTKRELWCAELTFTIDDTRTNRRRFCKTFEEACQAREEFERELGSEFLRHE